MKIPYSKSPTTISEQFELLKSRGMGFSGINEPEGYLYLYGYYRLSAYWYPFRQVYNSHKIDAFKPRIEFAEIIRLYEFDSSLRIMILEALEQIEIRLRTLITYHFTHFGKSAFVHYDSVNFHEKFDHWNWCQQIEEEVTRSRDQFIQHFKEKYEGYPKVPLWMLTEVLSIGKLSRLFCGLPFDVRNQVAAYYSVHRKTLEGWFHRLSVLRNICAHHGRLWNRVMPIQKGYVKEPHWQAPFTPSHDRFFFQLLVILHLLPKNSRTDIWLEKLWLLLKPMLVENSYQTAMGFPENWKSHPLLKDSRRFFENPTP